MLLCGKHVTDPACRVWVDQELSVAIRFWATLFAVVDRYAAADRYAAVDQIALVDPNVVVDPNAVVVHIAAAL